MCTCLCVCVQYMSESIYRHSLTHTMHVVWATSYKVRIVQWFWCHSHVRNRILWRLGTTWLGNQMVRFQHNSKTTTTSVTFVLLQIFHSGTWKQSMQLVHTCAISYQAVVMQCLSQCGTSVYTTSNSLFSFMFLWHLTGFLHYLSSLVNRTWTRWSSLSHLPFLAT